MARHKIANYQGQTMKDFAPEERHEIALKAGAASGKARRKYKAAKAVLKDILNSNSMDEELSKLAIAKGIEPTEMATLLLQMTKRAGRSANMAELIFKLSGDLEQAPQQNITIVNQLSDEQLLQERQRLMSGGQVIDVTPRPPELED